MTSSLPFFHNGCHHHHHPLLAAYSGYMAGLMVELDLCEKQQLKSIQKKRKKETAIGCWLLEFLYAIKQMVKKKNERISKIITGCVTNCI